jgi:uncharacterized protein
VRGTYLVALGIVVVTLLALPAAAASTQDTRTVTMTGDGSVSVVPDVTDWTFGVYTEARTARKTLGANSDRMRKVIAALKGAGIAKSAVRTDQVWLSPREDSGGINGYAAANSVRVTVDVDKAGDVIDAAVSAGANQVYGPYLRPSQAQKLYQQALGAAFDNARDKAKTAAAKAGLVLGQATSITEQGSPGSYTAATGAPAASPGASSSSSPPPLEAGEREVDATVSVTFEAAPA